MVVKKENRGEQCSKQFTSNYAATEALKPGFGATKHFVQRSKDGEEGDADNTN